MSAISFLSEYPEAQIAVVEPDKDNFMLLKYNVSPYNLNYIRAYFFEAAVYNKDTDLLLYDSLTGSHGYRVTEDKIGIPLRTIAAFSIDTLLKKLKWETVDIIKIDVEGAEKEIFRENLSWLRKTKYLIVETHDRFKPNATKVLFKALEDYDYKMEVRNQNLLFKFF